MSEKFTLIISILMILSFLTCIMSGFIISSIISKDRMQVSEYQIQMLEEKLSIYHNELLELVELIKENTEDNYSDDIIAKISKLQKKIDALEDDLEDIDDNIYSTWAKFLAVISSGSGY